MKIHLQRFWFCSDSLRVKGKYRAESQTIPFIKVVCAQMCGRRSGTRCKSGTASENASWWGIYHHCQPLLHPICLQFCILVHTRYIMLQKNWQGDWTKIEGLFLWVWKVTLLWKAVPVHCKEIGKKVHFHHNKDSFCSNIFILTSNFTTSGYFSENKKPLYSHSSGKTESFTRKI